MKHYLGFIKKIHMTVPSKKLYYIILWGLTYANVTKGQGGIWNFIVERFLNFT